MATWLDEPWRQTKPHLEKHFGHDAVWTKKEPAQNISEKKFKKTMKFFCGRFPLDFRCKKSWECALVLAFRLQKFNASKTNSKTSSHSIVLIKKQKTNQTKKYGSKMRMQITKWRNRERTALLQFKSWQRTVNDRNVTKKSSPTIFCKSLVKLKRWKWPLFSKSSPLKRTSPAHLPTRHSANDKIDTCGYLIRDSLMTSDG